MVRRVRGRWSPFCIMLHNEQRTFSWLLLLCGLHAYCILGYLYSAVTWHYQKQLLNLLVKCLTVDRSIEFKANRLVNNKSHHQHIHPVSRRRLFKSYHSHTSSYWRIATTKRTIVDRHIDYCGSFLFHSSHKTRLNALPICS